MTGGSSGFGEISARRISRTPGTRLLVGARGAVPDGLEARPLDLASLASVRAFADAVREWLDAGAPATGRHGDGRIDSMVLNAGIVRPDADGRTVDGFETTFQVDHLAHALLLRLLLDRLADDATVVFTTSGTHDPAEHARFPLPRHADARRLAHPERDHELDARPRVAGRRAYTTAKLCAVLTARAVDTGIAAPGRHLTGIAFCPGETPGTGLVRDLPLPARIGWRLLAGPLRRLSPESNRPEASGRALADLALGFVRPPDRGDAGPWSYAVLRSGRLGWRPVPPLAADDEAMIALWRDSAELCGLPAAQSVPASGSGWASKR
ncbi:dehydrogenase [Agromyces sp. CFH 90414]|uniref:Dehydrogenase n=1 Tax=Agromyces agglutinans TaxID=2662258 RepID=A0A6I2FB41_9MICO|nr:dehydrogenase [Agromyces agglutinans]MRG59656.1 dehydrogenase [Agromyces agglutinans]